MTLVDVPPAIASRLAFGINARAYLVVFVQMKLILLKKKIKIK